jgi:hypothetical protein
MTPLTVAASTAHVSNAHLRTAMPSGRLPQRATRTLVVTFDRMSTPRTRSAWCFAVGNPVKQHFGGECHGIADETESLLDDVGASSL